jgi:sugar phosphate isomerase/epimerase
MKNKIGVVTSTYPNYNAEEALKGISEAGFKYVEMASSPGYFEHILPRPEEATKEDIEKVLSLCKKYGLELYCIAGHTRLMKENGISNFKKVIDYAKMAGIRFITTDTGEVKTDDDEKKFYRDMKDIGDYANLNGVTICLEMHGSWCNNGNTGAEIIEN